MVRKVQELLNDALELDLADRTELTQSLLDHLESDEALDPAFVAELDRRSREADSDPSVLLPAEVVFRRIRERLGKRA